MGDYTNEKNKDYKRSEFRYPCGEKNRKRKFLFHEYEMAVEYLNHIWDSQTACLQVQDDLFVENRK